MRAGRRQITSCLDPRVADELRPDDGESVFDPKRTLQMEGKPCAHLQVSLAVVLAPGRVIPPASDFQFIQHKLF